MRVHWLILAALTACGCATKQHAVRPLVGQQPVTLSASTAPKARKSSDGLNIVLTSGQVEDESKSAPVPPDNEPILDLNPPETPEREADEENAEMQLDEPAKLPMEPENGPTELIGDKLQIDAVINSVHNAFPLVEAAYREADLANGNIVAAEGAFDTKVKASSENGPTGFYQTYRQKAGVVQPLANGGEVFAGYRVGRGDFEPWYQERQTNDGGEFKIGGSVPLLRNRDIDARRAALWRAEYDAQIAQPEIRTQLIAFTFDASLAYWKWVAEGRKYFAEREWLTLAAERNAKIKIRVEKKDLDPPELTDNERAIAKRKSKVADQLRKVQQAAVKLSLYLRDANGNPVVPTLEQIPVFPKLVQIDESQLQVDIDLALSQRPDLQMVKLKLERLQVDYEEASNLGLPRLDAYIAAGQDVGAPTSSKRDKSEFELDAGVFFDVPLQRRKATGKMQAIEAKMAQVTAKQRYTMDKIAAGVRAAYAGMRQAYIQAVEAQRARTLANRMAQIERRRFEVGVSDLLKVALREQYALEAIEGEVLAMFNYYVARSQYFAELGSDRR